MAAGGLVFDIGVQTTRALERLENGVGAGEAGPQGEWDNGNGSLMRILPLALWHRGSDQSLFEDACRQSVVTHGHRRSQICCGLFALWGKGELLGEEQAYRSAVKKTRRILEGRPRWKKELELSIRPDQKPAGKGSGYVVDCLHSARLALEESSFESVARRAVSLGNDTDTTAAVACGIAGIRHGLSGIPERWRAALAEPETLEPLAAGLESWRRA